MKPNPIDPRGLIRDAYSMAGISAPECRSIFLDWALEPRKEWALHQAAVELAAHYAPQFPEHPMTEILQEAMTAQTTAPKRRGGRKRI